MNKLGLAGSPRNSRGGPYPPLQCGPTAFCTDLAAQCAILIVLQHERPFPLMLTRHEPIASHVHHSTLQRNSKTAKIHQTKGEKNMEIGSMSPQMSVKNAPL
jgi:hypothetical protein